MLRLKFIDLNKESNLDHGIEFFAVGLIVDCHMQNGLPNPSGKDYAVEYIDPFGDYQHEWRASDEIEVSTISDVDFDHLKLSYEAVKNR